MFIDLESLAFTAAQESYQLLWFTFLNLLVLDDPIVIFIKESENLSEVLWLLLQELIEDVVLSPFDLFVIVKIICLKKLLFNFSLA